MSKLIGNTRSNDFGLIKTKLIIELEKDDYKFFKNKPSVSLQCSYLESLPKNSKRRLAVNLLLTDIIIQDIYSKEIIEWIIDNVLISIDAIKTINLELYNIAFCSNGNGKTINGNYNNGLKAEMVGCVNPGNESDILRNYLDTIKYKARASVNGNTYRNEFNNLNCQSAMELAITRESVIKYFHVKDAVRQANNTNIFLGDILEGVKKQVPIIYSELIELATTALCFSNDQMCNIILSAISINNTFSNSIELCIRMCYDVYGVKLLNTILKSTGNNSTMYGSLLCEGICLQGMPEDTSTVLDEVDERVTKGNDYNERIKLDQCMLYKYVTVILNQEVDMEKYNPSTPDEFWHKRWLWSVNGAHTRALEKYEKKYAIKLDGRLFRKIAMENYSENIVTEWSGKVYVSPSVKPEIGKKGRLIMGCDTASYAAFSYLLDSVERCWRNKSVLLDPGSDGYYKLSQRIRNLGQGVNVMMDYDSFDTQHSLESQQTVIQALCDKIKIDPYMAKKYVDSFQNMQVIMKGDNKGKATHALMSGHRATTFINSVLNKAYIMCAIEDDMENYRSLHTGDDIYLTTNNMMDVSNLFNKTKLLGIKMNPLKQSVGYYSAEFLRCAVTATESCGYVLRAIPRLVSGNWESGTIKSDREVTQNFVNMCHTIRNRARSSGQFATVVSSSLHKKTRISKVIAKELCNGTASVDYASYMSNIPIMNTYISKERLVNELYNRETINRESYATEDFLTHGISEVEAKVLTDLNISVKEQMVKSSYFKKDHEELDTQSKQLMQITRKIAIPTMGYSYMSDLSQLTSKKGVLDKYPILQMIKDKLPVSVIQELLHNEGYDVSDTDARRFAFTEWCPGNIFIGNLPYSEMQMTKKYVSFRLIQANYNCFM